MIKKIPYKELGRNQFGWLDARHHFSFGGYFNPKRMGFGTFVLVLLLIKTAKVTKAEQVRVMCK